ncbi:MAG TPA: HPP family protein [Cyclobacteriaceae bacterium]
MDIKTPISKIMTTEVVVASTSNKFTQVLELFSKFDMHHLLITDENEKLIGMISQSDIIRFLRDHIKELDSVSEDTLNNYFTLEKIMTKHPKSVSPQTSIGTAADVMNDNSYQVLPITEHGHIKGIVSVRDIVNYLHALTEKDKKKGFSGGSYLSGSTGI